MFIMAMPMAYGKMKNKEKGITILISLMNHGQGHGHDGVLTSSFFLQIASVTLLTTLEVVATTIYCYWAVEDTTGCIESQCNENLQRCR